MDLLEIIMLIIGVSTIFLSSRIVARLDKGQNDVYSYNQEELDTFKEQQGEMLSSLSDETMAKTGDYLSKLSNEKIMAVSEYSDQILEKISRNHEEVIFLYNMLDHKEKEIKNMNTTANTSGFDESVEADSIQGATKPKQLGEQARKIRSKSYETSEDIMDAVDKADNTEQSISINNKEILKLHKQDKSVLDIAKQLGIGQGEVKLVIDLFKDR